MSRHVDLLALLIRKTRLRSRALEKLRHQRVKLNGALLEHGGEPLPALLIESAGLGQSLRAGSDGGDRILELVREVREERLVRLVPLRERMQHGIERVGEVVHLAR